MKPTEETKDDSGTNPETRRRFSSVADPVADPHINGEYFKQHPNWHLEFSPWKAKNVFDFLAKNHLRPGTICEVGCGAGEVLRQLQLRMDRNCQFWGYDVAPHAIDMAKDRENESLHFEVADLGEIETPHFDLMLILEVVDHVEDYLGFLRMVRSRADWKLFSFSLDISVQSALRSGAFTQRHEVHNHLHHFNKETALNTLKYAGYEVVDYDYASSLLAIGGLAKLARPLRVSLFKVNPDLAVRLFGGYSLLVLTR